ncbi:hypothetical protein F5Y16DRAFT_29372 [Xylariaceae sp. FL0255]|nr:hypothetical protein F5Y16DRAFT_29372 [Xylariaceae sp. FL0255]
MKDFDSDSDGSGDYVDRQVKTRTSARATRSSTALLRSRNTHTPSPEPEPEPEPATPISSSRPASKKRKHTPTEHPTSPTTTPKRQKPNPRKSAVAPKPPVFPPWKELPYLVWVVVFDHIAAPLRDPEARLEDVTDAFITLLAAAYACRTTTEPALTAMYRCVPFDVNWLNKHPQTSFIQFSQTLALDPTDTLVKYRSKVKTLRLNADTFLNRKVGGDTVTLRKLIKDLPNLTELELYHPTDAPPYNDLALNVRCKFAKQDLLDALHPVFDENATTPDKLKMVKLESWRWNSRLVNDTLPLGKLSQIHELPSFQSLRRVAFVNYQLPSLVRFAPRKREGQEAQDADRDEIAHLAASISALPQLKHLIIESSTLANGSLLERLPRNLKHLELVNCWEINSDNFAAFLLSHGSFLTHLTLKHCQSLSLGFLTTLGTACPRLTHLDMDLSYFRHYGSYADNKPEYDSLLENDQIPTWPSSIQSITIIHLRNWGREPAENFFGSLMDNAKSLPHLRRLVFKVILNIGWRERVAVGRAIVDRMNKVFKRKSPPPREHYTLRINKIRTPRQLAHTNTKSSEVRRSTRQRNKLNPSEPASPGNDVLGSPTPSSSGGLTRNEFNQKMRIASSRLASLRHRGLSDADSEGSSGDELARGNEDLFEGVFVQGLCDVVDIQLDNQRPAERRSIFQDFMDTEAENSDTELDAPSSP